ncbi:MAG: arsenic ABC transporter [Candidatus Methanomethylophilaceae archaeon]|nr:arsenic ABC transporter [Candidatus Methanomethylophilaceae archaeon]MBO7204930.1 arsenic ABC transporter [Candidatus Methanomethylophilaceae archaeon]
MSWELIVASIIFIATYAAISLRRLPGIEVGMHTAALIGAALMMLFGIVSLTTAWDSLNLDVLFLLLGMMLLVGSLDACGFFNIVANLLIRKVPDGKRFLIRIMLLSAILSALMLNDAVVLILTPAVIRCCKLLRSDPIPFLIGVFVSANIGSCATIVGNPQNAYIATHAGIGFMGFTMEMLPMTLACLLVSMIIMLALFRKRLSVEPTDIACETTDDRPRLYATISVAIGTIIMFALSSTLDIGLAYIAMTGGCLALLIVATKGHGTSMNVVRRVDWKVLLFFIGLFIIMAGTVSSGLLDRIADLFPGFRDGDPSPLELTVFTVVLSNLISNVPSVILIGDMISYATPLTWLILSASSTLAGNLTLIGAAANVIVSEEAEKEEIRFDFRKYLITGIPVSLATLAVMYVFLVLL